MKKILSIIMAVAMVAMMLTAMASTASAADLKDGLVGFYKFEGNLNNEVEGGAAGTAIGNKFKEAAGDPVFDGGKLKTSNTTQDGVKFSLKLGKSYTVSIKVKADKYVFASPIVWIGGTNQSNGENWVGLFHDFEDKGPALGSNSSERIGVAGNGTKIAELGEVFVTMVIDNGVGTLYYNGEKVGTTPDGKLVPDPFAADDCALYIGVNAWDPAADATYDNLSVYNRALSADEVKALSEADGDPIGTADPGTDAPTTDAPTTGDTPTTGGQGGQGGTGGNAPATGFATAAIAIVAISSGAYIVSKKRH